MSSNNFLKKFRIIFFIIIFLSLYSSSTLAEKKKNSRPGVTSETDYYIENGILYTDRVIVKFNRKIFELPSDVIRASIENMEAGASPLHQYILSLQQNYGEVEFIKRIPKAVWGDTLRTHRFTGELVVIEDLSQLFTLKFNRLVPIDSLIEKLEKLPEIEYAAKPLCIVDLVEPDDDHYLSGDQWNLELVQAAEAWNITKGNTSIKIATIDNGADQDHDDFQDENGQDKIVGGDGENPVANAFNHHGSRVAGIAAAGTNNNEGIASLGWNLRLLTYNRHLLGVTLEALIDDAVDDGADIINMSFFVARIIPTFHCEEDDNDYEEVWAPAGFKDVASFKSAVSNAIQEGVICIAAAGNSSLNTMPESCDPLDPPVRIEPANFNDVIAISGTNSSDEFVDVWNYDTSLNSPHFIDVTAPGKDILSIRTGGGYNVDSGTSFAAPHVCALAGLIRSINPGLSVQDVQDVITNTADKINVDNCPEDPSYDGNGWNRCVGYGRINAHEALLSVIDDMAEDNESSFSTATGNNNGRRLVRDSSGDYHLVFASAGKFITANIPAPGKTLSG